MERLGLSRPELPARKPRKEIPAPVVDEAEDLEPPQDEPGLGYRDLVWDDDDLARKAAAEDAVQAAEDELSAAQEAHDALVARLGSHDARQGERDSQRAAVEAERAAAAAAESVEAVMAAEAKLSAIATVDSRAAEKRDELSKALAAASERVAEAEKALTAAKAAEAKLFEEIGRLIPHGLVDLVVAHRAAQLAETSRRRYPAGIPADELGRMLAGLPDAVAREAHEDLAAFADEYQVLAAPKAEPAPWSKAEAIDYFKRASIRLHEIEAEERAERDARVAYANTQTSLRTGLTPGV